MTSAINRYYDPTTDEFLTVDPDVATTDQPYIFVGDDPLNGEDPLGLDPPAGLFIDKVLVEYGVRWDTKEDFPNTVQPFAVYFRVQNNKITNLMIYNKDGNPEERVDLEGPSHYGIDTPHIVTYQNDTMPDGEVQPKPLNDTVRSAPSELVPTKDFEEALLRGDSDEQLWELISRAEDPILGGGNPEADVDVEW